MAHDDARSHDTTHTEAGPIPGHAKEAARGGGTGALRGGVCGNDHDRGVEARWRLPGGALQALWQQAAADGRGDGVSL